MTVISPPLYIVHKMFGSNSLQTHIRSKDPIFNDEIKKFNPDRPPPFQVGVARAVERLLPNI
jgi:hypothetical protein